MSAQKSIFELVDDIGTILEEKTAGKYQSNIEDLYYFSLYLTYCVEADYSAHIEIFQPMYNEFVKTETDDSSEQYHSIMRLFDDYKNQLQKLYPDLANRAEEFASDSLNELNMKIIKNN